MSSFHFIVYIAGTIVGPIIFYYIPWVFTRSMPSIKLGAALFLCVFLFMQFWFAQDMGHEMAFGPSSMLASIGSCGIANRWWVLTRQPK